MNQRSGLGVGAVSGISLRPDGNALVAGCFDTRVSVIDLRAWRITQALEVPPPSPSFFPTTACQHNFPHAAVEIIQHKHTPVYELLPRGFLVRWYANSGTLDPRCFVS